jgi:SRSO17 transposase
MLQTNTLPPGCTLAHKRGLFAIGKSLKGLDPFFREFSSHWVGWSRGKDTKRAAKNYFAGIILPGKRKNMSRISRRVRLDENTTQQFITDSPWDGQEVMATCLRTMSKKIANEKGILILDDTGQAKKGDNSPGVQRQYSGTLGKTGNCQVFVNSTYCIPGEKWNADVVYWPTGMGIYIPEKWFEDKQRCKKAGIPEDLVFRTKPQIALELIERVRKEKVPHQAIVGDAGYGSDGGFRSKLRKWHEPYVLGVNPSHISVVQEDADTIPAGTKYACGTSRKYPGFPNGIKPKAANVIASEILNEEWDEVTWSEGTKGTLSAHFTRMRVRVANAGRPTEETGWLLFEKTKDGELKAYICWGFDDHSLEDIVGIAHTRWVVEQVFKQMKSELGLDDFEGRKWKGWHHHAAMVMIAFCYLMLLRANGDSSGEKLPSLPQVRREMARLFVRKGLERKFNLSPEEADEAMEEMPYLIPE